jgi:hypothetical protein
MVRMNHGSLPTAPFGRSPPPCPFGTGDLYFLPKIWSKSVVIATDLFEDTLKRPITTIPPSITTTHHDGGLSSPLSYTLADDDPPLPSTRTQRSRQNLRERTDFKTMGGQNGRQCSLQTNWKRHDLRRRLIGSWREADKQREALDLQVKVPFLFEWDDLSEKALWDKDTCLRQQRNAYEQMKTDMGISSHFVKSNEARATNPSPRYHQFGSKHAKESERRKQRRERRKKAGTSS